MEITGDADMVLLLMEIINGKKYGYELPADKCVTGDIFAKLDDSLYICINEKWFVVPKRSEPVPFIVPHASTR